MTNAFRRTTTQSTPKDNTPPTPVNPYIVGTNEWCKFRSKTRIHKSVTRNSIFTRKKREERNKHVTYSQVAKNSELIDKILNFTFQNGWMQIDGSDNDGKWINTKHYGNKVFNSGKIYEHSTGETHYFPLGDTYDDPLGIALNYKNMRSGIHYTISPNTWTTLVTRSSIKKKKRENRSEEQEIQNRDIVRED